MTTPPDLTRIRDHARSLVNGTDPAAQLTGRHILRLLAMLAESEAATLCHEVERLRAALRRLCDDIEWTERVMTSDTPHPVPWCYACGKLSDAHDEDCALVHARAVLNPGEVKP